jgi:hypothetical protein
LRTKVAPVTAITRAKAQSDAFIHFCNATGMVFSFRFKNLVSTTILHIAQFVPKNQRATTNRPSTFSVWDGGINFILFSFTRKKILKKMAPLKPEKATEPYSDSDSSDSREEDEEGWDDVEQDEEETQQVISLLDDKVFPDVLSMLEHCKEKHSFDFLAVRQKLQLDFHGCVKLVNYSKSFFFSFLPKFYLYTYDPILVTYKKSRSASILLGPLRIELDMEREGE